MPKIVEANGHEFTFPDNATDDEIADAVDNYFTANKVNQDNPVGAQLNAQTDALNSMGKSPEVGGAFRAAMPDPSGAALKDVAVNYKPSVFSGVQGAGGPEAGQGGADFSTLYKASFVDDPAAAAKIFAKARFPNLPENEALKRYGYIDGQLVYVGEDGKIRLEQPNGVLNTAKGAVANITGGGLPEIVGAGVGAVSGGLVGAGIGGSAGTAAKKIIGNTVFGEQQTPGGNFKDIALSGAVNAATTLPAYAGIKWAERLQADDLAKLNLADVKGTQEQLKRWGITSATPAQITQLKSLVDREKLLRDLPESADKLQAHTRDIQNPELRASFEKFLGDISPVKSPAIGSRMGVEAARESIKGMEQSASAAAKPYYNAAANSPAVDQAKSVLDYIDSELVNAAGSNKTQLMWVRNQLINRQKAKSVEAVGPNGESTGITASVEAGTVPKSTIAQLDEVKKAIDARLSVAPQLAIDKRAQSKLLEVKNRILALTDEASPEYKKAREVYGKEIQPAAEAKKGLPGDLARTKPGVAEGKASKLVFNPANYAPEDIAQMMGVIRKQDPAAADAFVASHLRRTMELAAKETQGGEVVNFPGKVRQALFGDEAKQKAMRAALTPQQFEAMKDLMSLYRKLAVTAGKESMTEPRRAIREQMQREAVTVPAKAVAGVAKLASPSTYINAAENIGKWIDQKSFGKYAAELADVITSPEAMKELKALRSMTPNERRFWIGLDATLISMGKEGLHGGSDLSSNKDSQQQR